MPAGLSFVYATASSGTSYDSSTGVWTIPSLVSGAAATLAIRARVDTVGEHTNTATITHADEYDPNGADNQASATVAAIFDPPSGYKTFTDVGLAQLEWRVVWINSGNGAAENVQVSDAIPPRTSYVGGSLACEARGSSSTVKCEFDAVDNRVFWQGIIGPDLGAGNDAAADNEVVITFRITVPPGMVRVVNQASALTDTNGDGYYEDETTDASVSKSNAAAWTRPAPVPLVSSPGIAVLCGLLTAIAAWSLWRGRRQSY
jgi:uncharacterized repeat protein (TIGR01451 family)